MLNETQEIIYRKGNQEIARISLEDLEGISLNDLGYLRYYQPFTHKGCQVIIPLKDNRTLTTSRVESVEVIGNVLVVKTINSIYEIEYKGIDLERVLADGEFKGVNVSKGLEPAPFPKRS